MKAYDIHAQNLNLNAEQQQQQQMQQQTLTPEPKAQIKQMINIQLRVNIFQKNKINKKFFKD